MTEFIEQGATVTKLIKKFEGNHTDSTASKSLQNRVTNFKKKSLKHSRILISEITQLSEKEENEEKLTNQHNIKEKLSSLKQSLKSSIRELGKSSKKTEKETLIKDSSVKEQSEKMNGVEEGILITDNPVKQQLEETPLTFKDVIKKRIFGKAIEKNDPDKLSILKNMPRTPEYSEKRSLILEFANYLIYNETYLSSIPISKESKKTTPEILDDTLNRCEKLEDLYNFLDELCNDITKIKKEEKEKKMKKFLETNQKDLKDIKKEVEEKRNSDINTENTILTQSQLDTEEISKNIKSRDKQKESEKQENKKIKKKEQKFKKLFEDKSNNIVIERKKGFVDKDRKYHQFGGFHYEIKSKNITYIIDVNEKELSKLKSRSGGTIKFTDLEKCLTLSMAGIQIKSGINTYRARKMISEYANENSINKFELAFEDENLNIESKKKAFLKAFGEYMFNQQKQQDKDKKFKDYKRQKTIPDEKNEKGQKINYLYYVLTTKPKGRGR